MGETFVGARACHDVFVADESVLVKCTERKSMKVKGKVPPKRALRKGAILAVIDSYRLSR